MTVVAPVKVLVPVRVHTPVPTLVIAAGWTALDTRPSRIVPAKVASVLRPPTLYSAMRPELTPPWPVTTEVASPESSPIVNVCGLFA